MDRRRRLRCEGTAPRLSALLDGELAPREHADVRAHVAVCAACREELESLARVRTALRSLPPRRRPAPVPGAIPEARPTAAPGSAPLGSAEPTRHRYGALVRVGALAAGVGAVAGVLALGGGPAPDTPVVRVPVELFVADHLMHNARAPAATPVLLEGR